MKVAIPACVAHSPRETADLLRSESARLYAAVEPLREPPPVATASDELWARARRVRAETQRLCAAAEGLIARLFVDGRYENCVGRPA